MIIRNILVALVAVMLGACTIPTKMRNLSIKDNFTVSSLENEKLLFGGLTSSQQDWTESQIATYSDIARSAISAYREDVQVSSPANLIEKLGKEEFYRIHQEFAKNHGLSKESIVRISEISTSPKYIMFSRLLSDYINHQQNETDIKGTDGKTNRVTERKTIRYIVVSTKVYDLISFDVVMSGEMWLNDSNTKSQSLRHRGSFLKDLATNLLLEDHTYPDPPSLEGMLNTAFRGISENLPHKSCKELGFTGCGKKAAKSLL